MSGQKAPVPPIPKEDPSQTKEEKEKSDKESGKDELIQRQKESERSRETATDDIQGGDLSEEDRKLKENLTMLVERVVEPNNSNELRKAALDALSTEIRTSTSSMTAIPKPLKFLRPHYDTLREFYQAGVSKEIKPYLADVLSILSMVMQKENERLSLAYRLEGSKQEIGMWGHEYLRHLAAEIAAESDARTTAGKDQADVQALVDEIVPFFVKHNAETDAVDLLLEVDRISFISQFVTSDNYSRVASYMVAISEYTADAEEKDKLLRVALDCLLGVKQTTDALRVAFKLNDRSDVTRVIDAAKKNAEESGDRLALLQVCFMLGAHRYTTNEFDDDDQLKDIVGNVPLVTHYKHLAQDLDVQEAKSPEDIYKSHLAEGGSALRRPRQQQQATKVDSAKQNLASSFVNAFVNGGFGSDSLLLNKDGDWLYKNKDHGQLSAAASLGLLLLWDLDTGFDAIDKYTHSAHAYIKAGALLAEGIVSCGVTSEMDASLALLGEHIDSTDPVMRQSAALGLGIAYAGTGREDVQELLVPLLVDPSQPFEVSAIAGLSLGLVFLASSNDEISGTMIEVFMERSDTDLKDSMARVLSIGLGLLFLGRQEQCSAILEAIKAIEKPIAKFLELTVESAAYFGSGNVLKVQHFLSLAGEHLEDETKDKDGKDKKAEGKEGALGQTAAQQRAEAKSAAADKDKDKEDEATGPSVTSNMHQAVAVLGLALVTCGEELGSQMTLRSLDNLLQYGDVNVRRAVPLALAILSISHPRMTVVDTLSKLSHDVDQEVSQTAILCLGFVGAGTNNSRIATLLRQLATYYAKEPNHLFLVRIAQGLLHLGKGLLTLSPFHADHSLYIPTAAAGLLVAVHAALDLKNTILSKRHYLLYALVPAIRPRMLMTVDENLKPVPVKVKYGTSVDTVGAAGKPKSITGFQTHQTPILLSHGERAELATDEWIPLTNVLEDIVIVRKNPDAKLENE